jgi:predicted ArsR family transcriptional regulator
VAVAGVTENAAPSTKRDGAERVRRALRDTAGSLSVRELVGATRLHENAVRRILTTLLAAGDVLAEREMLRTRGRPILRYRIVGAADAPFRQLVPMLLDLLGRSADSSDAYAAGRRYGESDSAGTSAGAREAVVDSLATLGFAPVARPSGTPGRHVLDLTRCPFTDAVTKAPNGRQICHLHHGLVAGVAAAGGAEVDEFVINDPRIVPCRVGFRAEPEQPA